MLNSSNGNEAVVKTHQWIRNELGLRCRSEDNGGQKFDKGIERDRTGSVSSLNPAADGDRLAIYGLGDTPFEFFPAYLEFGNDRIPERRPRFDNFRLVLLIGVQPQLLGRSEHRRVARNLIIISQLYSNVPMLQDTVHY